MSLSHKILETIGQSALDKGYVNKNEYAKVKDLHRDQKEAHRKAKELGVEERYLPKDISQKDFVKDIENEKKYGIKESVKYGDMDPEVVKDDAFLNIDKNENGYSVKAGIGDHTDLGSGNYTFIPDNEVSRLYNEVLDKVKSKKIKYHDRLGKEEVERLDSVIPNYNKDLEQDIKDLEPYANRPLKRRELDDILDITGRRDASGSSERQMKHRLSGDYGRLSAKVGDLKRYLRDLDDEGITEFWIN